MLINKTGNVLVGKTSRGDFVKVTGDIHKTISELNGTVREKTIREIKLNGEKEVFQKAFPQYNDFRMILRHDSYTGKKSGTSYYGYLSGLKKSGESVVLIRQSKNGSEFSDITIGYHPEISLPRNPSIFEGIIVEAFPPQKSGIARKANGFTKVTNIFARAYLRGGEILRKTESATDEFYKIMRSETKA